MYFPNYTTTYLEDWVSSWYQRSNIVTPNQLKIVTLARKYEIHLHRKPLSPSYQVIGRFKNINLDSRTSPEEQREQFYHEFSHILRHAGIQSMLPEAFRELQERDAKHFTMYGALPHHMISKYDFRDESIVERWAHDFRVTEDLCLKRYEIIRERSLSYELNSQKRHKVKQL